MLAPILSLVNYYFLKFYPLFSVSDFLLFFKLNPNQVTAVSVPCLILNIALFTFFINKHKDKTAKGLFAATLAYALLTLILKFFL
jgi:hypothetical protein